MYKIEVLDISGDVGIRVIGDNLPDIFVGSAAGMFGLITDINKINPVDKKLVTVTSEELGRLIIAWLNELIFLFDTYNFIGKTIELLSEPSTLNLTANVYGETFDPDRHERRLLIKAATYHKLRIEKKDSSWELEVIFDI